MQTSEDLQKQLERALTRALNRGWHRDVLLHMLRRQHDAAFRLCRQLLDARATAVVHPAVGNVLLQILNRLQSIPKADLRRFDVGGADSKVVEKIRALIAKAEATDFPEEAEAFMAKAQELITKHAIDEVTVRSGGRTAASEVVARHVLLEEPYLKPKYALLCGVAAANRCSAVLLPSYGFATVFGAPSDVDAVELLFTSLLAQATMFMLTADSGQGRRKRSFRHAFLLGFANRIGHRLAEATAEVVDDVPRSERSLLPALVERERAASAAAADAFPDTRRMAMSASNAAGIGAGHSAANRASLGGKSMPQARGSLPAG